MIAVEPLDVLCFGEALVDFFPERPGVPLEACEVFHRHLGGAPCNVAVALQRTGSRAGLMTLVGPDAFGSFVRERLASEGVSVRGVGVHRTAKTGVTFVAVARDGARSFLFFRHPSADQMISPDDVDGALVGAARVFHLGSSTLCREPARAATLHALATARAAGCVVSIDPNWRPHLWDDPRQAPGLIEQVIAQADIVKISDDELQPLCGERDPVLAAARLRALGPALVVITLGARGCLGVSAAGEVHLPGVRAEVVDTTGAGDAFVAGLLGALVPALGPRPGRAVADLSLAELRQACARGNQLGAQVVTQLGATAALPRLP